jgi:hypothetical protein
VNASLELGAQVAGGPLATVHRGVLNGRAVAVKRARPDVPGAAAALRREARVLTAAAGPGIVAVLDLLHDPETPALVLGWADGGSLADLLADGPLPPAELLHLLRPLAQGLDALHAAGAAHLDVTVHNVLLAAAGPVLIDPAPPGAGTPGFADPVVVAGGPPSSRSDVFGLAACAHVALTGRLPRIAGGLAVGLDLDPPVADVLAAGLDPDPRRRPPSASGLVDRLELALTGSWPADRSPVGTAAPAAAGRPVEREPHPAWGPARTWPFDRWHEEAEAAADRRRALAEVIGASPHPRRHRRAIALAVLFVLLATGVAAAAWQAASPANRRTPVRTSASDSTQRPPAARPPPTTTPGGRP